jgi:hypothetical protein
MYSIVWNLIESKPNRFYRLAIFLCVILISMLFSFIPHYTPMWFSYAVIIYPLSTAAMLGLIKYILRTLPKISETSIALVKSKEDKQELQNWWDNLNHREHVLWCIAIALILAGLSLSMNFNPSWLRFLDALGVFYIGFIAGEIAYLLLLVPSSIAQLNKFSLQLNPIFPAHTVKLQILAESSFFLALQIGISLFFLNLFIALALFLYPYLIFAIVLISILSWTVIIGLSIFPHFILFQLAQEEKRKTLALLENKLVNHYHKIINAEYSSSAIDDVMKLHEQVNNSKTFPISNNAMGSLIFTMLLNILPIFLGYFIK